MMWDKRNKSINIFIIINIYDVKIIVFFQNINFSKSKQSIYVF